MGLFDRWYETFFEGVTSDFWNSLVTEEFTKQEGEFLLSVLEVRPDQWLLDAPSGRGRMALWLAQKAKIGAEGWDINLGSIESLNQEAQKMKVPVVGVLGDLTQVPLGTSKFDGAITLGNCFGYFDDRRMDRFINNISGSLRRGGRWVIHSGMLAESIFPNWQDSDLYEAGGMMMEIENAYDPVGSRVEIRATITTEDGREDTREFCHYVYTLKEVCRMLSYGGLQVTGLYKGFSGEDFALGDEQIYIVVERI